MPYRVVTDEYTLPGVPEGWSWHLWTDEVDGHRKIFVRLRNELGHSVNSGVIDVGMYGDRSSVVELAQHIVGRGSSV